MNQKQHADHIYIEALLKNDSRVLSKLYEKFSNKIVAFVRKNNLVINDDFKNQALANTERPVTYDNAAMPADLRGDHKLDLATIFGNGSRFSFTSPKCVLLADAKPKERSFTFAPDCHVVGRQIIARLINIPLRAGAKIAFAINTGIIPWCVFINRRVV